MTGVNGGKDSDERSRQIAKRGSVDRHIPTVRRCHIIELSDKISNDSVITPWIKDQRLYYT
jgi:hypothetical protein